ncbi:MAG: HAMP domain-containing sensor histidine kinase [Myxococcota bacterium]
MVDVFLLIAVLLQGVAVVYGVVLAARRQGAPWAWLFLVGAMLSMLTWRVVMATGAHPPAYFTPLIALWGSSTMFVAMWLFDREIARRMRAEAERDALLTSERLARSDAERASQLKDEFLATLSHELRTPLAAVLGWCAVVRHAKDRPAEVAAGIDTIERNARAQARLVDDLLEVTRMSAGMLDLERSPVRLDEPVRASIEAARVSAEAKGVGLALLGGPAFPRVLGDAGRLQQIVGNLLTNAVKFTPAGGRVTVQIGEADGRAAVVVADTGEGIDPAFLPHLFGRFRQADSSTRRRHGGLGLGLSIVDHLVRLHGGEVRAASPGPRRGGPRR